jgi:hypothetical protein
MNWLSEALGQVKTVNAVEQDASVQTSTTTESM